MKSPSPLDNSERVLLVGVALKNSRGKAGLSAASAEESLFELDELGRSAGAHVMGRRLQVRDALDSATVIGRGILTDLKNEAAALRVGLIIFDRNLSATQLRNLERGLDRRVIDRTQLILDIFARHARTREGQLQVELAQLNYLLPRLSGISNGLSRLGGGIGTRGPGEQKLEIDRRRIRNRIRKIEQAIEELRRQRTVRRRARQGVPLGSVALVGYTNAGKSTLFNAVTHAEVLTSSKMFATLDPTVRALRLPSRRRVLFSDTVGFIRDLPPSLITAFRATLEEVQEASVILQVTDVSNPLHAEQDAEVEKILDGLGVADRPRLHAFNKIDRLSLGERALLRDANFQYGCGEKSRENIFVSAHTGEGLDQLISRIDQAMPIDPIVERKLNIPAANGRELAMIYACGHVLHSEISEGHVHLQAQIPESLANRFAPFDATLLDE